LVDCLGGDALVCDEGTAEEVGGEGLPFDAGRAHAVGLSCKG
jgi:hypothetical protein